MLEYVVSLRDMVTGPARMAGSSMLSLAGAAHLLKAASGALDRVKIDAGAFGGAGGFGKATSGLGVLTRGMNGVPGAASGAVSSLGGLVSMMAGSGPAAVVEFAAAVDAAVVGAMAAFVVAGMAMSIQAVGVRNALENSLGALAGGAVSGKAMVDMLDGMSDRLPQTRAQLGEWSKTLLAAGVSASALPGKLTTIASAEAMLGHDAADRLAASFAKLEARGEVGKAFKMGDLVKLASNVGLHVADITEQLKIMGVTGAATNGQVSKAMELAAVAKGAGALAGMAGSLASMGAKFQENIGKLFEGVDIKPFTSGLKSVLDLFSQGSASGKAMKMALTATFNAIFSVASMVFPVVKSMILGIVIAGLKVYIAMKPVIGAIKAVGSALASTGAGAAALSMIGTALKGLAIVALVVGAVVAVGIAACMAPLVVLAGAVMGIVGVFGWLIGAAVGMVSSVLGAFSGLASGASDAASNMIASFVSSIASGGGAVVDAMTNLASSAVGAFKSAMGIHSPSKIMMTMGGHTAMGVAKGMDQGAQHVEAASEGLADAAAGSSAPELPKGQPASKGAGARAGKSIIVNMAPGTIQLTGVGSNGEGLNLTEQALALVFDRLALKEGLGA